MFVGKQISLIVIWEDGFLKSKGDSELDLGIFPNQDRVGKLLASANCQDILKTYNEIAL